MSAGQGPAILAQGVSKLFASTGMAREPLQPEGDAGAPPPAKARGKDTESQLAALDDVSLEVPHGALTALVGPDGAGKTTFLRLAAGLMRAQAGRINVLGFDVARQPQEVQDRISYMPQRFGLYEDLSVQENLDLYADLHGVPADVRRQRYDRLLHMTDLASFTGRLAGKLSGGMKQKLGLACTLVRSPDLLLLDEPTVGVDPLSRRELWEIIRQLVDDEDLSVLVTTSYMDEAERCARVYVLHEGKLLAHGSPADIARHAAGRCFVATPPPGQPARDLQARLLDRRQDIVDAAPHGGEVRYIVRHAAEPAALGLVPAQVRAVPERLEDGFMVLLHARMNPPGGGEVEGIAAGAGKAAGRRDTSADARAEDWVDDAAAASKRVSAHEPAPASVAASEHPSANATATATAGAAEQAPAHPSPGTAENAPTDASAGNAAHTPVNASSGTAGPAPANASAGTDEPAPANTSSSTAEHAPANASAGAADQVPVNAPAGAAELAPANAKANAAEDASAFLPARTAAHATTSPKSASATTACADTAPGSTPPPNGTANTPAIEVRDLVRKFGDFTAVDRTTFTVARGEIFGLLGPNGAGKTTTFRMLCGLLPATSGEAHVAGMDLRRARARARQRIGYVSQKFALYGDLSAQENLRFFGGAYGLRGAALNRRIGVVARQFDLQPYLAMPAGQLPGGVKQRLAMAVGLLHEPDILFLDEPTSGADPLARRSFWRRITALATTGTTIVITTHFMEEAEYCDRIVIQDAGKLLALGSPEEVRRQAGEDAEHRMNMEQAFIGIVEQGRASSRGNTQ